MLNNRAYFIRAGVLLENGDWLDYRPNDLNPALATFSEAEERFNLIDSEMEKMELGDKVLLPKCYEDYSSDITKKYVFDYPSKNSGSIKNFIHTLLAHEYHERKLKVKRIVISLILISGTSTISVDSREYENIDNANFERKILNGDKISKARKKFENSVPAWLTMPLEFTAVILLALTLYIFFELMPSTYYHDPEYEKWVIIGTGIGLVIKLFFPLFEFDTSSQVDMKLTLLSFPLLYLILYFMDAVFFATSLLLEGLSPNQIYSFVALMHLIGCIVFPIRNIIYFEK